MLLLFLKIGNYKLLFMWINKVEYKLIMQNLLIKVLINTLINVYNKIKKLMMLIFCELPFFHFFCK